jgi:hypothetical protein
VHTVPRILFSRRSTSGVRRSAACGVNQTGSRVYPAETFLSLALLVESRISKQMAGAPVARGPRQ